MSGEHYHTWNGAHPDTIVHEMADKILAEMQGKDIAERASRRAFATLLKQVADAMHELGYVDSGDTTWSHEAMPNFFALIGPRQRIDAAVAGAREAHQILSDALKELQ